MTRITIDVLQDGRSIPGFPYIRDQQFSRLYSVYNRTTNTASYQDPIPALNPSSIYFFVSLFKFSANQDVLVSFLDNVAGAQPFTLPAGALIVIAGAFALHQTPTQFFHVKATVNPTIFHTVVGVV